jgi:hypothetical protein
MKVARYEVPGNRKNQARPVGACRTYPEGIKGGPVSKLGNSFVSKLGDSPVGKNPLGVSEKG